MHSRHVLEKAAAQESAGHSADAALARAVLRARLLRRGVFANAGIVCSLDVCCASQRCLRVLS